MNATQYEQSYPTVDEIKSQMKMMSGRDWEAWNLGLGDIISGEKYFNFVIHTEVDDDGEKYFILDVPEGSFDENRIMTLGPQLEITLLVNPKNPDIYCRAAIGRRSQIKQDDSLSQLDSVKNSFSSLDNAIIAASECCLWLREIQAEHV